MSMKKSREEVAYNYLKECGPCLITYQADEKIKILLSENGEIFWLNDAEGPTIPYAHLDDVLQEAKHLLLELFTADMKDEITIDDLFSLENMLRNELAECLKLNELDANAVREIKIKFLDVKEGILAGVESVVTVEEVKPEVTTKPAEQVKKAKQEPEPVVEEVKATEKVEETSNDSTDDEEFPFGK